MLDPSSQFPPRRDVFYLPGPTPRGVYQWLLRGYISLRDVQKPPDLVSVLVQTNEPHESPVSSGPPTSTGTGETRSVKAENGLLSMNSQVPD